MIPEDKRLENEVYWLDCQFDFVDIGALINRLIRERDQTGIYEQQQVSGRRFLLDGVSRPWSSAFRRGDQLLRGNL